MAVMRINSPSGDFVALERTSNPECAGDLFLVVRVQKGHFAVEASAFFENRAWNKFAQELACIEKVRKGRAWLRSMRPGEVDLRLKIGLEGLVINVAASDARLGASGELRVAARLTADASIVDS